MNTLTTISKKLTGGEELVVIPRREYDALQAMKRVTGVKTFRPTMADKRALKKARLDYQKGNYLTIDELKHKLGITRS
ncbi:MAG: hypothetical protein AAB505_02015 [Patescibacteria group bacterium]